MDILVELEGEHRAVRRLVKGLLTTANAGRRAILFRELKQTLIPHTRAEEQAVYPSAVLLTGDGLGVSEIASHELADRLLAQLDLMPDKAADAWSVGLHTFKDLLFRHLEDEEDSVFMLLHRLSRPERRAMADRFAKAKKRASHPRA